MYQFQLGLDSTQNILYLQQEIKQLKKQLNTESHGGHEGSELNRSRHDSTDSIDDQDEIKKLKSDIVRLQTECHHWKTLSSSQVTWSS